MKIQWTTISRYPRTGGYLDGTIAGTEFPEFLDEGFDFSRGAPCRHIDPIHDTTPFERIFINDIQRRGRQIDVQHDTADRTHWVFAECRVDVFLHAHPTKDMMTFRANRVLCLIVADSADKRACFVMFLEDEVRVIGHLSHPGNQLEDVCVIIEDDVGGDKGIKLPLCVSINTLVEILLLLIEEIPSDGDHAGWQTEIVCALDLCTTQHDPFEERVHLLKRHESLSLGTKPLNRFEEFGVEPTRMIHGFMTARIAVTTIGKGPVELLAVAFLAKVVGERVGLQEPQQGE